MIHDRFGWVGTGWDEIGWDEMGGNGMELGRIEGEGVK